MGKLTPKELDGMIKLHAIYNNLEEGGVRLELPGANLRGANLEDANLEDANLGGAYLKGIPLEGLKL